MTHDILKTYLRLLCLILGVLLVAILAARVTGQLRFPPSILAWSSERDRNYEIYVLDLTTNTLRNISRNPYRDFEPVWSPDGLLVWESFRPNPNDVYLTAEIYLWDSRTGEVTNVTDHPEMDHSPVWSPDGRLTWMSERDGNKEIYTLDMESGEVTNLTQHPAD
ncbi:MAG TPA: hypothetical protein VK003_02485, partial [Oceanobacillus sp.]|nr:hypothetical protein [Oceanobacillus sp.]